MAIYTKKGDSGTTGLFSTKLKNIKRVSKGSDIISAIGSVDEANSYLGICISLVKKEKTKKVDIHFLENIQRNLFTIGSILAGAKLTFEKTNTLLLEKEIDKMENTLSPLTNFILPGGTIISAHLMYSRTLVRRMEREVVRLKKKDKMEEITKYINRLSDYLFILSRHINQKAKYFETRWVQPK